MNNIPDLLIELNKIPTFDRTLHVGLPNTGDRQRLLQRFNDLLNRRWLSNNGPFVQEFESRVAEMIGVKHCIATCNATVALQMVIRALGLRGEVIVPSWTFIATAHAVQWVGITPVFCDVDPVTHNLDPVRVEEMITPHTTGILGVHLWGRPCDVDALQEIADRRQLRLLFDAAHAFGTSLNGKKIGCFGEAEIFSFHATKFINTFEGGMITTDNDKLADMLRLTINFGFAGVDRVVALGTNGKMSEISAAMGLTSLESIGEITAANRRNYYCYRRLLSEIPGIKIIDYDDDLNCNYQYIVIEVDARQTGISRDVLVELLHKKNVMARRYFYPGCHRMEPYRSCFPHAGLVLPITEKLAERVLVFPTGPTIQPEDIEIICRIVQTAVEYGQETVKKTGEGIGIPGNGSNRVLVHL